MNHSDYMRMALEEAKKAAGLDEVPVGAVIVGEDGSVLAKTHNLKESTLNPCGHAEILALQKASQKMNSWRLKGSTIYVTLEPCMMCTGAIVHARISKLVFGASDLKTGFVTSLAKGLDQFPLNHKVAWQKGVLEEDCSNLLKKFFKAKRNDKQSL